MIGVLLCVACALSAAAFVLAVKNLHEERILRARLLDAELAEIRRRNRHISIEAAFDDAVTDPRIGVHYDSM